MDTLTVIHYCRGMSISQGTMYPMGEPAGLWLRVSSKAQDEESQRPDCMRWIDDHEYDHAETYMIHGRSAFKGSRKFDKIWAQVISDLHDGKIKVLVVWKQNRIDRKLQTFQMIAQVVAAGGRVEFVSQPHLNNLSTMGGRISLKIEEEIAYAESKGKSDNIIIKQNALRAKGSVVGRSNWGLEIFCTTCERSPVRPDCNHHIKILKPNKLGRTYIEPIFDKVIAGESTRDIALWLRSNGITDKEGKLWADIRVCRLIRNPVYYGQRVNAGQLVTEALVSFSKWQEANAALVSRVKGGRSSSVHPKALLTPECGACDKGSPMYRVIVGPDSNKLSYYRCSRGGPKNNGCGAPMIRMEELDGDVTEAMLLDPNPHIARVFIPGDDRSDEIGKKRQAAMNAYLRGEREEFERLDSEATAMETKPGTVPHWEERYTCETCGPVIEETPCVVQGHHIRMRGEHFVTLSLDERREEIRQGWIIKAKKGGAGIYPRNWP